MKLVTEHDLYRMPGTIFAQIQEIRGISDR
jgi:hypothetical protein